MYAINGPLDMSTPSQETLPEYDVNPITEEKPTPFDVSESYETEQTTSSTETVERRSEKFKFGLNEILQKSKEELYQSLAVGEENQLRVTAASEIDKRKREISEKAIVQYTANKQGPLTREEADGIYTIIANMNEKTDPASVLEEAYAKQFMATMDRTAERNPDNVLNDAKKEDLVGVIKIQEEKSDLLTKREYAQTLSENIEDEIKNQGWVPFLADQAKMIVPLYTDAKLRGNADVSVFASIGLGQNLEEQRKALLRLPFNEYKIELDRISKNLREDNPTIAAEFVKSVVGMSVDDVFIKSATLPLDLAGTGIVKGSVGLGRKLIMRDIAKAAEDIAKEAANPNASKSTIFDAAGDLKEAAIVKATTNAVTQDTSDATRRALESLPSVLRADLADIKANPGRASQELVNRIEENTNTITSNLLDAVKNISKVERLPEVMATETAVRAIQENIKNTYTGIRNSILDVSKPYKEPVANTWLVDLKLGKNDGTYFTQRSVAENFIEAQGLRSGQIVETSDKTFRKEVIREAKLEKDIAKWSKDVESYKEQLKNPNLSPKKREELERYVSDEGIPMHIAKHQEELSGLKTLKQTATVEQQGLGYYIKITKPINETDDVVRDFIATTKNTRMPESNVSQFVNGIVGKIRTPEEVLSLAERQNRLTTTYTPSIYFNIMRENFKEIQKLQAGRFSLKHKRWKEWQRILEAGQDMIDPSTGLKGYFFKDIADLETNYQQILKRLPDEQEVAAYFEFKRGMEIDRIFRNLAIHRNQQRVGAETHKIVTLDENGARLESAEFNGVTKRSMPRGDDNVVIMGEKLGDERVVSLSRMAVKEKDEFDELIKKGQLKAIELYDPELRSLNGFGSKIKDNRIRYVIAKNVDTRELDWNHIPRRGGGHVEYDYDFYIKQAKVSYDDVGKRYWYEGDVTLMPIQIQKMGENVTKHLNEVRKLLKDKNDDAARAYSNKNLHIDWETVSGWFKSGVDENGVFQSARLSLNEPIQILRKNETIVGKDKTLERRYSLNSSDPNFKDGTKEGSLARQSQIQFTGERDAFDVFTLTDEGTRRNPLYKIAPAKTVDPISVLNRGLNNIARSNFMDDYKTMAVEHWLKQAAPYLKATDSEIRHAPFFHFEEAAFKPNADQSVVRNLEAAKFHIKSLTGVQSVTESILHSASQKLADSIYSNLGSKASALLPFHKMTTSKDPIATTRSLVFHSKLGLFNIPQFIVQAGNYSNILGIAGMRYAAPGTLGAQLHFWSRVNSSPQLISHLDSLASKMNLPGTSKWKPGEFTEAFEELKKTGFGNVGGEYAALDNPGANRLVTTGAQDVLEMGTYFFKQGERNAKYGAWYTAFKEFRDKNPIGRITPEDRAKILQRADLLNVNMSRASSSALHTGVWSIPTQFYTYQIRLMELFAGTRLTNVERARLFATNAVLYGIPMAGGLTGIPVADSLRKYAMENGYVVGDDYFSSMIMEGLPSAIGAVISGEGNPQKGVWQDVGTRFGTKGFEFLGGLNRSDKTWLDVVGGPLWGLVKGTIEQSDGFTSAMVSMIKADGSAFPMVTEDIVDVFKEITSVNTAWRTIAAIESGRWISKKEAYLADTSAAQAIFSAVTGLKDQQINDIQTMNNSMRDRQEYEKEIEKRFLQEFKRGVLVHEENPEQAKKFWTRAQAFLVVGGYPERRINSLVSKAVQDNKSILDKMNFDFYVKKAPDKQKDIRMDAMKRTLKLKEKRGEE